MRASRLHVAFVSALALYLVAITLPWYVVDMKEAGLGPIRNTGWLATPVGTVAFFLLAFSWVERGRAGRLVLRDGSILLLLSTVAGLTPFGVALFRTVPHLSGVGLTWWTWVTLAASAAACALAGLLARQAPTQPVRSPTPLEPPLAAWAFVLPLLAVPLLELVPSVANWYRPRGWGESFVLGVLLGAWALAVRRGAAPTVLGLRVAREIARLVALYAVSSAAATLVAERLRTGWGWGLTLLGLLFAVGAPLVAWAVATAWARGGYRELPPGRVPELLRVDRLGPDEQD